MTTRRRTWTHLVMTVALASGAAFVRPAEAKKPKVSVTIDGKGYKYRGRFVVASTNGNGTSVIATKPARKILRTVGVGCAYYLPNETFPLVANPDYCTGSLTETRVGGSYETKAWFATSGIAVTYESFDGTWATGTFSGILDPLIGTGAEAPAAYEGTFRVKVVSE